MRTTSRGSRTTTGVRPGEGRLDIIPTHIAINGASFPQRITGVQRYAREVTARMLANPDVRLLLPDENVGFTAPERSRIERVPSRRGLGPLGAWAWVNTSLRTALRPDELLWSPTIRAPISVRPHVPTVHDLSVLDHPEWFRHGVVTQWRVLVPRLCRQAAHVITDSEFSRERLITRLGLSAEHVSVVACGVDPLFGRVGGDEVAEVRDRLGLPERFIFSLGSVDPRKNVGLLIEAWHALPSAVRAEVPLVLAGGTASTFAPDPSLRHLPDGVVHLGYVDDADLPGLYAAATVFAYPSLYEGFGLPPLEAMAAGTPVVALASTGAVNEVVRGAGMLVEGVGPNAFAEGINQLLSNESLAGTLVKAGRDRAAEYSWDLSAERVLGVLRDVRSST